MSKLAKGQEVKYTSVRVRVLQCTSSAPRCWYRKHVGETLKVDRKTWYQDGKITHQYYEMKETPGGGFNGHLSPDDVEEL